MTDLICTLGGDKATVTHVKRVIDGEEWERVYVVCAAEHRGLVPASAEAIVVDKNLRISELSTQITASLKDRIQGMEHAINFISGDGKLHMATVSALLKMGIGIRLVALTPDGVREI